MSHALLCGFEQGSRAELFGRTESANTAIRIVSSSPTPASGDFCMRCNPAAAANAFARIRIRQAGGTFPSFALSARFKMLITTMPDAQAKIWLAAGTVGSELADACVLLNSDGTIVVASVTSGVVTTLATSSNALTADALWHLIEVDVNWNGGTGIRVFVDGVEWVSYSLTGFNARSSAYIGLHGSGWTNSPNVAFDDLVVYSGDLDDGRLHDWKIVALRPVADSAVGGWVRNDGTTATDLWTAVDDAPPDGTTSTTLGTNRIENSVSSATDDYDADVQSYDEAGIPRGATILAVSAQCDVAQTATTGSPKAGAIKLVSNPADAGERSFDYGLPQGNNSTTAAAMGTHNPDTTNPGWGTHNSEPVVAPTVDRGVRPVVRVGKRTATTEEVDIDFVCALVLYRPGLAIPAPPARPRQALYRR